MNTNSPILNSFNFNLDSIDGCSAEEKLEMSQLSNFSRMKIDDLNNSIENNKENHIETSINPTFLTSNRSSTSDISKLFTTVHHQINGINEDHHQIYKVQELLNNFDQESDEITNNETKVQFSDIDCCNNNNDNNKKNVQNKDDIDNHSSTHQISDEKHMETDQRYSNIQNHNDNFLVNNHNTAKNILHAPFPLLAGEILEHKEITDEYSIHLTNYRLYVKIYHNNSKGTTEECQIKNYQQEEQFCLPINNIDSVELRDLYFLIIYTKHIQSFVITFQNGESASQWHKRLSDIRFVEIENLFCFQFYKNLHSENANKIDNDYKFDDLLSINQQVINMYQNNCSAIFYNEFDRMKFDSKYWQICTLNKDFKFCNSYPQYFIVPNIMNDTDLECIANFRYSRRIPVVVWRSQRNGCVILRSSQPVIGWLGWRNSEDEQMLKTILKICLKDTQRYNEDDCDDNFEQNKKKSVLKMINKNGFNGNGYVHHQDGDNLQTSSINSQINDNSGSTLVNNNNCHKISSSNNAHYSIEKLDDDVDETSINNKLLILDARSYTAAFANRVMGGGCECPEYYTTCDVQFMGLNNIHSIRKSFYNLRYICESSQIDQSNWFTLLDNTKWIHNLTSLLKAALVVVDAISIQERPVLVHCSDGWDRTPQVIALAELMLDPYYRTMDGFKILIEKEWLQFGHKFADRCRSSTLNIDPNERCPVFLQWIDCVHQLIHQFPHEFEFNVFYLMKLVYHSYSCLFGTFTCNNVQERIAHQVYEKTISLWSYFELNKNNFINYFYLPQQEILRPSCRVKDVIFWNEIYVPFFNNNNSVAANIISCNGICNSTNVNSSNRNMFVSGKTVDRQTILNNNEVHNNENKAEFNCNHEIRCQSQSKCDLNRSASFESLYNYDLKQLSTNYLFKNLDNRFNFRMGHQRHESDSCLFIKTNKMPNELDKLTHFSQYATNNPDLSLNNNDHFGTASYNKSCKNRQEIQALENKPQHHYQQNESYKNNNNQNNNLKKYNGTSNKLDINDIENCHLVTEPSTPLPSNSNESLALFDVDGQIIGKNNSPKQLEQLINYHKRMIRCLTYQLKCKKKNLNK